MGKMKVIGKLDGHEYAVEVEERDSGKLFLIRIDGKEYQVDARTMPSEIVTVLVDGKSYDIDLDREEYSQNTLDGRLAVRVRGRVIRLEMLDERRKKMKEAADIRAPEGGLAEVTAPMPGKLLRFLVTEGQSVKKGQGLAVVEAMKMENELQCPKEGVVKELVVAEGDAVNGGALILTVE